MGSITYNSTKDEVNKSQSLKGKTKLKVYQNVSNCYNETNYKNFRVEENPFSKNVERIGEIYLEVVLILNFLQTKPQVKNLNVNYYDLYYTVIKNRKNKRNVEKQHKVNVDKSDYNN